MYIHIHENICVCIHDMCRRCMASTDAGRKMQLATQQWYMKTGRGKRRATARTVCMQQAIIRVARTSRVLAWRGVTLPPLARAKKWRYGAWIDAALDDASSQDDNTQDRVSSLVAETISDEYVECAVVDRRTIDLFSYMTGAATAGSTTPISLADSHPQSGGASAQAVCSQDAQSVVVAVELSGRVDTKTFVAVPSLNLGLLNDFMNQVKEVKCFYDPTVQARREQCGMESDSIACKNFELTDCCNEYWWNYAWY